MKDKLMDNILPVIGTKKFGGSKRGIWGAAIGLIIGVVLFPPVGLIIGAFLGALAGELTTGKKFTHALGSSFGSFIGFLTGIIIKMIVTGLLAFYFIMELIHGISAPLPPSGTGMIA